MAPDRDIDINCSLYARNYSNFYKAINLIQALGTAFFIISDENIVKKLDIATNATGGLSIGKYDGVGARSEMMVMQPSDDRTYLKTKLTVNNFSTFYKSMTIRRPYGNTFLTAFDDTTGAKFYDIDSDADGNVMMGAMTGSAGSEVHKELLRFVRALGNVSLFNMADFDGSGVIGIKNCTAAPSTDPTGGGVLFVENGALKYKGSSGTVTTLASA